MLRVDDLCQPVIARAAMNHETYKLLYTQCIDHIKRKHETGCTITLFEVPGFVLGRPPYTHSHAVRYIAEKLRRGKFDVNVDGAILHIDWEARLREACKRHQKTQKPSKRENQKKDVKPVKVVKDEPLSVRLERLLNKKKGPTR